MMMETINCPKLCTTEEEIGIVEGVQSNRKTRLEAR